jgi:glycerol-3-phosphate acyltransferase PlsY
VNPWLFIPAAFLCGSIPFGMLIARARGIDIRAHGSGNIGATNVGRVLGRTWGVAVFALDVCKGLAPVLVAGAALGTLGHIAAPARDAWLVLATAAAAILGHVFCPWLRFKGGKGVATSLGALAGVFPVLTIAVALAALTWLAALRVTRMVGVASVMAAGALPVLVFGVFAGATAVGYFDTWAHAWAAATPAIVVTAALAGVVIVRHRGNLRRAMAGTEPKVAWIGGRPSRVTGP